MELVANELQDAILKLELKDGDILFVDGSAVNVNSLLTADWPDKTPNVTVVAVFPSTGQNITDVVFRMSKAELQEIAKA